MSFVGTRIRRRHGAVSALILLLLQADCASNTTSPATSGTTACAAEEALYADTSHQVAAGLPALQAADYLQTVRRAASTPEEAALRVASDIARLSADVDRANTFFTGVTSCRIAAASASRTAASSAEGLAVERAAYASDLADIRHLAQAIAGASADLGNAAKTIEASSPSGRLRAAKALAAPPPPMQPYVTDATASIHARPDEASPSISELRRGLRVQGPGGGPAPGWITLVLNDGSLGYVEADRLHAVALNPSAEAAAARASASRDAHDPFVALAMVSERTLPRSIDRLASSIDSASDAVTPAFGM